MMFHESLMMPLCKLHRRMPKLMLVHLASSWYIGQTSLEHWTLAILSLVTICKPFGLHVTKTAQAVRTWRAAKLHLNLFCAELSQKEHINMAGWTSIAVPFTLHFTVKCPETSCFVGAGWLPLCTSPHKSSSEESASDLLKSSDGINGLKRQVTGSNRWWSWRIAALFLHSELFVQFPVGDIY